LGGERSNRALRRLLVAGTSSQVARDLVHGRRPRAGFASMSWSRTTRPWSRERAARHTCNRASAKRLARRLIFFESPHLLDEAKRRVIEDDIAARRRGTAYTPFRLGWPSPPRCPSSNRSKESCLTNSRRDFTTFS